MELIQSESIHTQEAKEGGGLKSLRDYPIPTTEFRELPDWKHLQEIGERGKVSINGAIVTRMETVSNYWKIELVQNRNKLKLIYWLDYHAQECGRGNQVGTRLGISTE